MNMLQFVTPILTIWTAGNERDNSHIRPPAVAGQFYPDSAGILKLAIEKFIEDALPPQAENPLAIVVPHAGYIYSGQIAADGWNQTRNAQYDTIILLGTNHTTPNLYKIALYPPEGGFQTPLGTAIIDAELTATLLSFPDCVMDKAPHSREHSVEVQIPFAQTLFPQAKIVAAIVGDPDVERCTRFGKVLASALKNRRALIVASSDLSHYPSAKDAEELDLKTLEAITTLEPETLRTAIRSQMIRRIPNLSTCACGEAPIMVAMAAAHEMGATEGKIISHAHSGNIPIGERDRVVGYGAVLIAGGYDKMSAEDLVPKDKTELIPLSDRKYLLKLARETINRFLTVKMTPLPRLSTPIRRERHGVFVTLKKKGGLRGCIGRMIPDRPLAELVAAMALEAAFEDPRFKPVTLKEVPDLEMEISVLTPMKRVSGHTDIIVGRDGVMLQKGGRSAVFLPQVATEQGWQRDEMLSHLSMKAGLSADAWKSDTIFSTFQAIVFSESEIESS
jgi:AmmeMemoRadiSam system protein B/AmmeMemoRadiSam system protein A